jgi:hypothetical protein
MADPVCVGGAVDCLHHSNSLIVKVYFKFWRILGFIGGMAQGGCQFCRESVFHELGGYDETWYMGEDVDFYWRLRRLARQRGLRTFFIRELQVIPPSQVESLAPVAYSHLDVPVVHFFVQASKVYVGWLVRRNTKITC